MTTLKADFVKEMTEERLDVRTARREGVTNPRYSPVVPKRSPQGNDAKEADYMEMGVINKGFGSENGMKTNGFDSENKEVKHGNFPALDGDSYYLTPTGGKKAPPTASGDPQYEDLNQVAAKVRTGTSVGSSSGLPKRKANILYEPAVVQKKKTADDNQIYYNVPRRIFSAILIIGLLALVAFICCILLTTGSIRPHSCDCSDDAGKGNINVLYILITKAESNILAT